MPRYRVRVHVYFTVYRRRFTYSTIYTVTYCIQYKQAVVSSLIYIGTSANPLSISGGMDGVSHVDESVTTTSDVANEYSCEAPETEKREKRKKSKKAKKKHDVNISIVDELNFSEMVTSTFLSSFTKISVWWDAYQVAFSKELDWLESKGHHTSRGMRISSEKMFPLVFHNELGSLLRRICFIATRKSNDSDEAEVCCYATIDEDPSALGVCHLRMLLVSLRYQRMGIGLHMLCYIIYCDRFIGRHIGLKFARCNQYEHFYSKAGFFVIGADDLYVYMALRR